MRVVIAVVAWIVASPVFAAEFWEMVDEVGTATESLADRVYGEDAGGSSVHRLVSGAYKYAVRAKWLRHTNDAEECFQLIAYERQLERMEAEAAEMGILSNSIRSGIADTKAKIRKLKNDHCNGEAGAQARQVWEKVSDKIRALRRSADAVATYAHPGVVGPIPDRAPAQRMGGPAKLLGTAALLSAVLLLPYDPELPLLFEAAFAL